MCTASNKETSKNKFIPLRLDNFSEANQKTYFYDSNHAGPIS